ncbi:alpha/beta hydrolase [Niabella ginsengisoli]|uniref:Alpha/beta hydrolase n=1 Tax=Niabella ginsengisoli TaxID=522298 RepID=A0ABS9SRA2_9BACT|nr:alpha/beta hydrolase [Niabella ginsengisoli]MCH5600901.1 alpha/beta hydrolase [Niabella ginsengisoli]
MNWLQKIFKKAKKKLSSPRRIYCIPGFGADEKIFDNLKIENSELVFINWLKPLPRETYQAYVARMAEKITDENPIIIGVSFGGMVALEIDKNRPVKQIILISSVKNTNELPLKWRLIGKLKLNHIFPIRRIQANERFFALANKRLGIYTRGTGVCQSLPPHYRQGLYDLGAEPNIKLEQHQLPGQYNSYTWRR